MIERSLTLAAPEGVFRSVRSGRYVQVGRHVTHPITHHAYAYIHTYCLCSRTRITLSVRQGLIFPSAFNGALKVV